MKLKVQTVTLGRGWWPGHEQDVDFAHLVFKALPVEPTDYKVVKVFELTVRRASPLYTLKPGDEIELSIQSFAKVTA